MGVGEMIGSAQQGETRSEQVGLECWGTLVGVAALEFSAHQSQAFVCGIGLRGSGLARGGLWAGIARWSG